jgi:iron complex outermembrane recepter protein
LLYRPMTFLSMFIQASRGYSTPTLAEVRPSDGLYYGELQPESGWNYEAGVKMWLWNRRIFAESSLYYFHLVDAIVRRTNNVGAEYFVNAGGTRQQGWETGLTFQSLRFSSYGRPTWKVWSNLAWQNYFFEDYKSGLQEYSGNRVTGVPQRQWVSGLEGSTRQGIYGQILFQYTSKLPLNDANDVFAEDYRLLNVRVGWEWNWKKIGGEFYLGVENILNQFYSSGHDLNAFGRRYYNPSPLRNGYSGVRFTF